LNKADAYLDMDERILHNVEKIRNETGWAKQRQTAAKIPHNVLFGL